MGERLIIIIVVNSLRIAFQNFSGISVNAVIIFTVAGNEFDFINFNAIIGIQFLFGESSAGNPRVIFGNGFGFRDTNILRGRRGWLSGRCRLSLWETWPEWKNPVPTAMLMSGMRKTEGSQMTEK